MILNSLFALAEEAAVTELTEVEQVAEETLDFAEKTSTSGPFAVASGPMLIVVILALIIAFIVVSSFKAQMKTASKKTGAQNYAQRDTFRLSHQSDFFLYESVKRVPIQNNTPPQGGKAPQK